MSAELIGPEGSARRVSVATVSGMPVGKARDDGYTKAIASNILTPCAKVTEIGNLDEVSRHP